MNLASYMDALISRIGEFSHAARDLERGRPAKLILVTGIGKVIITWNFNAKASRQSHGVVNFDFSVPFGPCIVPKSGGWALLCGLFVVYVISFARLLSILLYVILKSTKYMTVFSAMIVYFTSTATALKIWLYKIGSYRRLVRYRTLPYPADPIWTHAHSAIISIIYFLSNPIA